MSARDDLDRFESEWQRHLRWRKPPNHEGGQKPGAYVESGRGADYSVRFTDMPSGLRERVAKRLESTIARLVDEESKAYSAELQARAIAEAERTLAELRVSL